MPTMLAFGLVELRMIGRVAAGAFHQLGEDYFTAPRSVTAVEGSQR